MSPTRRQKAGQAATKDEVVPGVPRTSHELEPYGARYTHGIAMSREQFEG